MKTCCENNQTSNCKSWLDFLRYLFLLGFSPDVVFLGISGSSISVIFFSVTDFSVRSTELENTARDFDHLYV